MKISKSQLKKIIKEEKTKLMEMQLDDVPDHGIFKGSYLYDLIVDEIEDYLYSSPGKSVMGDPNALTESEMAKLKAAMMFALENITRDYSG